MKINAEEIKNKDVKSMDKTQLDEFKKEIDTFASKTKFIRNTHLLKILYYVFGYALGIGVGLFFGRVLMTYIYTGRIPMKSLGLACVLLVVCVTVEVVYRVAKHKGIKYSKIITDKLNEINTQFTLLEMKEEFKKIKNEEKTEQAEQKPEEKDQQTNVQTDEQKAEKTDDSKND